MTFAVMTKSPDLPTQLYETGPVKGSPEGWVCPVPLPDVEHHPAAECLGRGLRAAALH